MPYYFGFSPATRGPLAGGAAATEYDAIQLRVGATKNVNLQSVFVIGKGVGLTAISGISYQIISLTTPGAAGTALTPAPKITGGAAAIASMSSLPTLGSTGRINRVLFGSGAAGPGGWVAPNQDSCEQQIGGAGTSMDIVSLSGTASLPFEVSGEIWE
jgi:hypothetical protein